MRVWPSLLAIVALGACSSSSGSPDADAGYEGGGDDGSTAGCTGVGGTCEPIASPSCGVAQQNDVLCGDTLLVCCLPDGGERIVIPEGGEPEGGAIEDVEVVDAPVVDSQAPPVVDAQVMDVQAGPPPDAGRGPTDAGAPTDAPLD